MNIRTVAIEDHGVSEHEPKRTCKVYAQLHHLSQRHGDLLFINSSLDSFNLPGLLDDSELKQGLVKLLALRAEENIEEIINHSRLSLQIRLLAHVCYSLFLIFFFFVFWVI